MKPGRLGVWYSTDKLDGSQLRDFVRTVENNGYSNLWYPESRGYESMSLARWRRRSRSASFFTAIENSQFVTTPP